MRLNEEDREKVQSRVNAICKAAIEAGEQQDLIWDIDDLRLELRLSLGLFAGLFNAYDALLSREYTLYSPEGAYLSGRISAHEEVSRQKGYQAYLLCLSSKPRIIRYYQTLGLLERWLSQLLQSIDLVRMLELYTAEYRQVYGRVMKHTFDFFDMGYDSEGKR